MEVLEKIIEIDNPIEFKWDSVLSLIEKQTNDFKNKSLIKLNLVQSTKNKLYFNAVFIDSILVEAGFTSMTGVAKAGLKPASTVAALIIPTGIGAAFGGYAGDANPLAKLIAKESDYLLVHPNVVNGAVLADNPPNLLYLEGYLLDQFLLGNIHLLPNNKNKIGVIFDKAITDERLNYEVNALNAFKAFYGCEIVGWTVTDKPLNVHPKINGAGFSSGSVENLDNLIEKAIQLKNLGASAIAICAVILDLDVKDYLEGKGIDPIGGVESIISRVVSCATSLVSAHAPVLISAQDVDYRKISPVSASEYIAQTFLPSVVSGLRFAPQIFTSDYKVETHLSFYNLSKILLPYNAFGSPGVFYLNELQEMKSRIFLVKENKTCLKVNPDELNIKFNYINSYTDVISEQTIQDLGIDPNVLKRPLKKINRLVKSETISAN